MTADAKGRAVLARDPADSRLAVAEVSSVIEAIQPRSPAEEDLKAALEGAVQLLQSLHAARSLLTETGEQSWRLLGAQGRAWASVAEGLWTDEDARKLVEIRPAIERAEPADQVQVRLRLSLLEACHLLDGEHLAVCRIERLIERAWWCLDELLAAFEALQGRESTETAQERFQTSLVLLDDRAKPT